MDSVLSWLGQNALGLLALCVSLFALFRLRQLKKQIYLSPLPPKGTPEPIYPLKKAQLPRLEYYTSGDRIHAIRNQKLVNYLSLHFRNTGNNLYYDNVEFARYNKRLEVEILANKDIELFTDPRDSQLLEHGESLRITFEREMGDPMEYDFRVFFQDLEGNTYYQQIRGAKGKDPVVDEPVEVEE